MSSDFLVLVWKVLVVRAVVVSSLLEGKVDHPPSELSKGMRVIYAINGGHVAHDVAGAVHVMWKQSGNKLARGVAHPECEMISDQLLASLARHRHMAALLLVFKPRPWNRQARFICCGLGSSCRASSSQGQHTTTQIPSSFSYPSRPASLQMTPHPLHLRRALCNPYSKSHWCYSVPCSSNLESHP